MEVSTELMGNITHDITHFDKLGMCQLEVLVQTTLQNGCSSATNGFVVIYTNFVTLTDDKSCGSSLGCRTSLVKDSSKACLISKSTE